MCHLTVCPVMHSPFRWEISASAPLLDGLFSFKFRAGEVAEPGLMRRPRKPLSRFSGPGVQIPPSPPIYIRLLENYDWQSNLICGKTTCQAITAEPMDETV